MDRKDKTGQPEKAKENPESTGLPRPSFLMLVAGMSTQVMMSLGHIPNPVTGETRVDLDHAKYTIDLLEILKEKTSGNLTPEEEKVMGMYLYDLRMSYVKAVS